MTMAPCETNAMSVPEPIKGSAISAYGTSRHFAALQNSVAIGGIADTEPTGFINLDL
jgi:hypothetical protein